jgi:magnesium-transporting ATPase (P-type)
MCFGDARKEDHSAWKFIDIMPMLDPPREDTAATIVSLHHANISVKMITVDHLNGYFCFRLSFGFWTHSYLY